MDSQLQLIERFVARGCKALVVAPSGESVGVLAAELGASGRWIDIDPDVEALANTGRPLLMTVRINGQLAKASTAAQNSADQNGAITQKLAPNSTSSRICTSRRSLLSMGYL